MKLISASRRTDIPAFYSRWFLNRIEAGYCEWANPFGGQVYRVSLRPEDCLGIVFWTRYPLPLLPHLAELKRRGYAFYFHFTLNAYERAVEARNPDTNRAIEAFHALAEAIAPAPVLWRYDPILFSDRTPPEYHLEKFHWLAGRLAGYTRRCYFSFLDNYGKTRRNLRAAELAHGIRFHDPDAETRLTLVRGLRQIASAKCIALQACCEDAVLMEGVEKAHCVDLELLRPIRPGLPDALKRKPTREECGCVESVDIGAYDTCRFGCIYCYATNSHAAARERARTHDPNASALWRP